MTILLPTSNQRGTVITDPVVFPISDVGSTATFSFLTRDSDIRNADKSFDFRVQIAPSDSGPWQPFGGFTWQSSGADMVSKSGEVNHPSSFGFRVIPRLSGWWFRVVCEIPETMRISIEYEASR